MSCFVHDYQKINEKDEPKYILHYASGYQLGVFSCKCTKCGKKKDKKFIMKLEQLL